MNALEDLAKEAGIAVTWVDATGRRKRVSVSTIQTVLEALGYPAASAAQIRSSRALIKQQLASRPMQVLRVNQLFAATGRSLGLTGEDGKLHVLPVRSKLARVALAPGYYMLDDGRRVAVTPRHAFGVEKPAWGVSAQVYSLRGSPLMGDFAALADFCEKAARAGGDAVMISPLHAQPAGGVSPYSPTSRQFLNPLYIPMAGCDDGNRRIDWQSAERERLRLLRKAFRRFAAAGGHAGFDRFVKQGGAPLRRHAAFMAGGPADAQFQLYLQWRTDVELARVQARAKAAGMTIGLIADLAVGVDPAGSDACGNPGEMLQSLTIGAPPDPFNKAGQNWGLTSFSPIGLISSGYEGFIRMVRAAMRHAGGIRLDHAMSLMRLWVVPKGMASTDGAYLAYPLEELLGLLCLESQRHRAMVIAEDLGTVPVRFRRHMEHAGLLGMDVLWFTRDPRGEFLPTRCWPRLRAALTTTHDLPTLAGWWTANDLDWHEKISGRPAPGARGERQTARHALWRALRAGGASDAFPENASQFVDGAIAALANASSILKLVSIEDFVDDKEQPNIPGTIDQHPNWRRRLTLKRPFSSARVRRRTDLLNAAAKTRR